MFFLTPFLPLDILRIYEGSVILMATTIARWGNSQAVRLPKDILARTLLHVGDKVSVSQEGSSIRLTKVPQTKAEAFLERFGDFQGSWRAEEADTGAAVGKEQFDA